MLEEISLKVMVEPDGADMPYSPPTEADYAKYRALVDSSKQLPTRPMDCIISDVVGPFVDGPYAAISLFVVQEPVVASVVSGEDQLLSMGGTAVSAGSPIAPEVLPSVAG